MPGSTAAMGSIAAVDFFAARFPVFGFSERITNTGSGQSSSCDRSGSRSTTNSGVRYDGTQEESLSGGRLGSAPGMFLVLHDRVLS